MTAAKQAQQTPTNHLSKQEQDDAWKRHASIVLHAMDMYDALREIAEPTKAHGNRGVYSREVARAAIKKAES